MKLRDLFIPRKTSSEQGQPDYGIDMRTIEIWAQEVVKVIDAINPSTGYASLTGPGETTTPGDLTQAGGFTVNDPDGDGINFNTTGGNIEGTATGGVVTFTATDATPESIVLSFGGASGGLQAYTGLSETAGLVVNQTQAYLWFDDVSVGVYSTGGHRSVLIQASSNLIIEARNTGAGRLGFFAATPVGQQSGAGVTTVAQLVTVLHNYGLLS